MSNNVAGSIDGRNSSSLATNAVPGRESKRSTA